MNLPQNIQKSDGAVARSFSQELGLNLDLKISKQTLWQSSECIGRNGYLIMKNRTILATLDNKTIALWDIKSKSLIRVFKPINFEFNTHPSASSLYQFIKITETEIIVTDARELFHFNIETGEHSCIYRGDSPLAYLKKQKCLIIYQNSHNYKLLNIEKRKIVSEIKINKKFSRHRSFKIISDDNSLIAIGPFEYNDKYVVNIYNVKNNKLEFLKEVVLEKCERIIGIEHDKLIYTNESFYYYDFKREESFLYHKYTGWNGVKTKYFSSKNHLCRVHVKNEMINILTFPKKLNEENKRKTIHKKIINSNCSDDFLITAFEEKNSNIEIQIFDMELNLLADFHCNSEILTLNALSFNNKQFEFPDKLFNLENRELIDFSDAKKEHHVNFKNTIESDFVVGIFRIDIGREGIIFKNKNTKEIHYYANDNLHLDEIEFIKEHNLWLIKYYGLLILYDAYKQKEIHVIKLSEPFSTNNHNFFITSNLKKVVAEYGNKLQTFNLPSGLLEATMEIEQTRIVFFDKNKEEILLIEQIPKNIRLKILDINLSVKSVQILPIKMSGEKRLEIYSFLTQLSNDGNKILLSIDSDGIYLFDLVKNTCNKFYQSEGNPPKPLFSTKGNYFAVKSLKNGFHLFNTKSFEKIGWLKPTDGQLGGYFSIDEKSNRIVICDKNKITLHSIQPFRHIADIIISPTGLFYIWTTSDQTSPNGWFYTNAPDKINVLKTKADSSEPELLPADDEERLAFIKHHNRKDIVMQKLFEPEKYEEFIKLNARAEDLTKQDLAIELKHIEHKNLKDRN